MGLAWASWPLKNDPEICKLAVANNGNALRFVADSLRRDREIAKIAISKGVGDAGVGQFAFHFLPPELKRDRELQLIALENANGYPILGTDPELTNDKELAMLGVKACPDWFVAVSPELRDDPEVVEVALKSDGHKLRICGPNTQRDPAMVKLALETWGDLIMVPDLTTQCEPPLAIQRRPEISRFGAARNNRGTALGGLLTAPEKVFESSASESGQPEPSTAVGSEAWELLRTAIKTSSCLWETSFITPEMRSDKENFVLPAIKRRPRWIATASDTMKDDKEVALFALQAEGGWGIHSVGVNAMGGSSISEGGITGKLLPGLGGGRRQYSSSHYQVFKCLSPRLKSDPDVLRIPFAGPPRGELRNVALKQNWAFLDITPAHIRRDPEFCAYAAKCRLQKLYDFKGHEWTGADYRDDSMSPGHS